MTRPPEDSRITPLPIAINARVYVQQATSGDNTHEGEGRIVARYPSTAAPGELCYLVLMDQPFPVTELVCFRKDISEINA